MSKVVQFIKPDHLLKTVVARATMDNPHIMESEDYYLSDLAIGIEIAIHITQDREAARFLMKKMVQAVNSNQLWVSLDLYETRRYLDYLDIVKSQRNKDWRIELAKFKYTG